jgi:hypothetical protein
MIYLTVSYDQKEEAKSLGAKWDASKKLWYAPDETYTKLIEQFGSLVPKPPRVTKQQHESPSKTLVIIGENRKYGGDELFVDLQPKDSNICLRRILTDTDFSTLRQLVVKRVAYKCEFCDKECLAKDKKFLEVCERFSYNTKTNTQKLERILGLCKECYSTVKVSDKEVALGHLMDINNLDKEDAKQHIKDAYTLWKSRCLINWNVDLSIITDSGLCLKLSDVSNSSGKIKVNKLSTSTTNTPNTPNKTQTFNTTKKITINKVDSKPVTNEECLIYDSD